MAEPGEQEIDNPGTSAAPDTGTSERSTPAVTRPLDTPAPPPEPPAPSGEPGEAPAETPGEASAEPPAATRAEPPASAAPTSRTRGGPDVLTLVVGLMSLAAAVLVLTGWIPRLPLFDLRWVLSGGAVVLGVLLLAMSARSPGKQ